MPPLAARGGHGREGGRVVAVGQRQVTGGHVTLSWIPVNVAGMFHYTETPRAGFEMLQILAGSSWCEASRNAVQARSGT